MINKSLAYNFRVLMPLPLIRKNFIANETLDGFIHEHALELYKSYLVIGGMPDVVKAYITENRMIEAINIQRLILKQ